MKVHIDSSFWDVFPEAQINVLVANGIDNHIRLDDRDYFQHLLKEAGRSALAFIPDEPFAQNDVIQQWRHAFQQFKTKKGVRSSIEALLKRIHQGHEFTPINPLVDLYNTVSLSYGVPCGGEDIDLIQGTLHLGKAKGGEAFIPIGTEEDAPALPEEIIYYDTQGAICRCLNWREAQRTMLTEDTTNAVLVIEAINSEQIARSNQAIARLAELIEHYFKVPTHIATLTIDNPTATFEA